MYASIDMFDKNLDGFEQEINVQRQTFLSYTRYSYHAVQKENFHGVDDIKSEKD